jgi:hypothetical protein
MAASQDILPGRATTQRHFGGQQPIERVAMDEPPAGELDRLDFAIAAQAAKQADRQAGETGSAAEVVNIRSARELFCKVGAGFMAADALDDLVEKEINRESGWSGKSRLCIEYRSRHRDCLGVRVPGDDHRHRYHHPSAGHGKAQAQNRRKANAAGDADGGQTGSPVEGQKQAAKPLQQAAVGLVDALAAERGSQAPGTAWRLKARQERRGDQKGKRRPGIGGGLARHDFGVSLPRRASIHLPTKRVATGSVSFAPIFTSFRDFD